MQRFISRRAFLALALNVLAAVFLVAGGGWGNAQRVLASTTQSYKESWSVATYADASLWMSPYPPLDYGLSVGPASWAVTGSNSSNGTSWAETWTADGWSSVQPITTSTYSATANTAGISQAGEYGWTRTNYAGTTGYANWPTHWTVTGTITTP